jgi:putative FmdB family regulatory protein
MPLYDFYCNLCKTTTEYLVKSIDTVYCPECSELLEKLPSSYSFKINGEFSAKHIRKLRSKDHEWNNANVRK